MNNKLSFIGLAVSVGYSITANALYIAPLQVEETQIIDSSTGNSEYSYEVDGVEIEITKKDQIRAKNWNLSHSDWAKYKYLMEYTPRGMWTKDLDPPLALGNAAQTDKDRYYYLDIQNKIEMARTQADAKMTAATKRLVTAQMPHERTQVSQFQSQLQKNKDTLRSLFVDLNNCDAQCKTFVTLAIASTSSSTQLDMHFNGGIENDAKDWLLEIGVDENKIRRKGINITAANRNAIVEQFSNGSSGAFYLNKTESGTTRHQQ